MSEHSPEPWQFGLSPNDPTGTFAAQSVNGSIVAHGQRADMERIVACVNFLAEIPTENLEIAGQLRIAKLKRLRGFPGRAAGYTVTPPQDHEAENV